MAEIKMEKPDAVKYNAKVENTTREKLEPVVSKSKIVSTKKPMWKKAWDLFIGEDPKEFRKRMVQDVLIPGAKDAVFNMVHIGLYGEAASRRDSYPGSSIIRSYSKCYSSYRKENEKKRKNDSYEQNEKIDYRNIRLENRIDAENLVDHMKDRIHDTGSISIAEFFDLLELPSKWTDNDWGWMDERDIGLRRVSGGNWLIDVAEARHLD